MKKRHFYSKYLEINIKPYQHLAFEFLPYGFGYENPLIIIKLFVISFFITLPFRIKTKDSDISYGFYFTDYDEVHKYPDYLNLCFGKYTKSYDMPWYPVLFEVKYDSNKLKGNMHIKDIHKDPNRLFKNKAQIILSNGKPITLDYYKEIRILKCKIFGRFIEKGKKEIYVLNIDYNEPNTDLSERGLVSDMVFLESNIDTKEAFKQYCHKNNLTLI